MSTSASPVVVARDPHPITLASDIIDVFSLRCCPDLRDQTWDKVLTALQA
jgi:hypothetical protein